jgi:hypothetical protein
MKTNHIRPLMWAIITVVGLSVFTCLSWAKIGLDSYTRRLHAPMALMPMHRVGTSGAMLIVEPRNHSKLADVTEAFSALVPLHWTLYVIHATGNEQFVKSSLHSTTLTRKTVFVNVDTLPYYVHGEFSSAAYNKLFKTPEFWNETLPADEEHVLVFQTDGMPCTSKPLDVAHFGRFGYVGCMCERDKVGPDSVPFFGRYGFYGIGGVSLRRRSFMLDCLRIYHGDCPNAEDRTFSACNDVLAYKYGSPPDVYDVGDFCGQCGWGGGSRPPESWAAHKVRMSKAKTKTFLAYCPAAITEQQAAEHASMST